MSDEKYANDSSELLREAREHLKERKQLHSATWSDRDRACFELGYRRGAIQTYNELKSQLALAEKALEFYAEKKHFIEDTNYTDEWAYSVKVENGERARETLKKIRGEGE